MKDDPSAGDANISAPTPLTNAHDFSTFQCGNPALDQWLKSRAHKAEGATGRTYVVTSGSEVVGYYTLATGGARREHLSKKLHRNSPETVPLMLLARLAVDLRFQGRGLGQGLLKDALLRILQASEIVGFRAVLVHAIDDNARAFYQRLGFIEFPSGSRTLFLPIETLKRAL